MARGFAGMSAERRREIASKGGQMAHAQGRAHVFDAAEASAAGAKGRLVRGYRAGPRKKPPVEVVDEDLLD